MRSGPIWLPQILSQEISSKGCVVTSENRSSSLGDQPLVKVHVVDRTQNGGKHLIGREKVMDIRPRESARTAITVAGGVDGIGITAVSTIRESNPAAGGEDGGRARVTSRDHAVEEVDAVADAGDQILRQSDAHQVAWLGFRQQGRRVLRDLTQQVMPLADRDAPIA